MRGWQARRSEPRERRASPRLTKREMRQLLSGAGRKWVKEVWQATARKSGEMNRLSPLTTPLGNGLVDAYAAEHGLDGEEMQRALRIALVAGYASRTVLVEPTEQPSLEPSAFHLRGGSDVQAIAGDDRAVNRLMDPVRSLAEQRFESVMTLPPEVWKGYVATATMRLQGQLATKTLSWQQLGRERIATMLRYGYVLRCLDEALDVEPELRDSQMT